MKTIKELADKFYKDNTGMALDGKYKSHFELGFEEAQRWIPIEEEMPKKEKSDPMFSKEVLTKNKYDVLKIERYDFECKCFTAIRKDSPVVSWRPINRD